MHNIKPHWIFALDDFVRNAVHVAVVALNPGRLCHFFKFFFDSFLYLLIASNSEGEKVVKWNKTILTGLKALTPGNRDEQDHVES